MQIQTFGEVNVFVIWCVKKKKQVFLFSHYPLKVIEVTGWGHVSDSLQKQHSN